MLNSANPITTTGTVAVDTTAMLTKAEGQRKIDSLGAYISAEGTSWGTYAQRAAISAFVQPGHRFYQTTERIGLWVRGINGFWEFHPSQPAGIGHTYQWINGFNSSVSGTGALYSVSVTPADSTSPGYGFVWNTGTTTNGRASSWPTGSNTSHYPLDTFYVSITAMKFRITNVPDATDDYVAQFGRIASATDTLRQGAYFKISGSSAFLQCVTRTSGGVETVTTTTVPVSSLTHYGGPGNNYDLGWGVIQLNRMRAVFFVNGVEVANHTTNLPSSAIDLFSTVIQKRFGTNNRTLVIHQVYNYQAKKY
jgi:hypothetical protein